MNIHNCDKALLVGAAHHVGKLCLPLLDLRSNRVEGIVGARTRHQLIQGLDNRRLELIQPLLAEVALGNHARDAGHLGERCDAKGQVRKLAKQLARAFASL